MSVQFRAGRYIQPSGFGLAVVDVPPLDPEKNISLIDTSYTWEENIANVDSAIITSYVGSGGHMPQMTVTDFVVTNVTTSASNDIERVPLYYRHYCRFYHYSYGEAPTKHVYITDQDENILKGINYLVRATRKTNNVYEIHVLTDFQNTESVQYKVKYNRCLADGTSIHPSWTETLNAQPLFKSGSPTINTYEYSLSGPDTSGLYTCVVSVAPVLGELTNSVGISFENAPTTILERPISAVPYLHRITYTLKATGTATYSIQRNRDETTGAYDSYYLQSATADTWSAAAYNFDIGDTITGIPGVELKVCSDNYLQTNDTATFTADRAYYYLKPLEYRSIYIKKPKYVTPRDDWYIQVKDGRFRRRMDADGTVVPSGQGTMWEYGIPEYDYQTWDLTYGPPYKTVKNEYAEILDEETIQLQNTPIFIDPSSVLNNTIDPGFPPTGYIIVDINDTEIDQSSILDWDVYNGRVKLAQILSYRDNVTVDYRYEEDFYEYMGFVGSGGKYPSTRPFPFEELDLNPTESHNYGMYASGTIAHIFLRPYINVDTAHVVYSSALYHNFDGVPSGNLDFELSAVSLGPHCRIDDIKVTDIRTRGGGLSKRGIQELEDVKDEQPEVEMYWDVGYFDGKAFPANGVLVIDVPKTVLKDNGGEFEEDEVRTKILKHMALGNFPIINFV